MNSISVTLTISRDDWSYPIRVYLDGYTIKKQKEKLALAIEVLGKKMAEHDGNLLEWVKWGGAVEPL